MPQEKKGGFIMAIVKYTTRQIKKMKSLTDWERIRNMKNKDIDLSDIPEVSDAQIKKAVRIGRPLSQNKKQAVSIRLSWAALTKLRASGKGWQTRLSSKITQWVSKGLL
jgi:uncharacterized protein (DUF4415 family)